MTKSTKQLFLTLPAAYMYVVEKGDISGAFLQGREFKDEVYVEPLKEITMAMGLPENSITRLAKPAYGLVQAPLEFYLTVHEFLESLGFFVNNRFMLLGIVWWTTTEYWLGDITWRFFIWWSGEWSTLGTGQRKNQGSFQIWRMGTRNFYTMRRDQRATRWFFFYTATTWVFGTGMYLKFISARIDSKKSTLRSLETSWNRCEVFWDV